MKNAEACLVSYKLLGAKAVMDGWRTKTTQKGKRKFGDDVPVSSHLFWVKGHDSLWRVTIIASFGSLFLFFSPVDFHHLFLLLRLDGHLAAIGRLGHFTADLSANIWKTGRQTFAECTDDYQKLFLDWMVWWWYVFKLSFNRNHKISGKIQLTRKHVFQYCIICLDTTRKCHPSQHDLHAVRTTSTSTSIDSKTILTDHKGVQPR